MLVSWLRNFVALVLTLAALAPTALAQTGPNATQNSNESDLSTALSAAELTRLDRAMDRATNWLARQQAPNGSFYSRDPGQPAITSFAVLALLSCGHQPGAGKHGERMNRAIDFVLECQQPSGLLSYSTPSRSTCIKVRPTQPPTTTPSPASCSAKSTARSISGDPTKFSQR